MDTKLPTKEILEIMKAKRAAQIAVQNPGRPDLKNWYDAIKDLRAQNTEFMVVQAVYECVSRVSGKKWDDLTGDTLLGEILSMDYVKFHLLYGQLYRALRVQNIQVHLSTCTIKNLAWEVYLTLSKK